jgi:hypothetical protein
MPSIAELLVAELDREMPGTRRALERVPEGQNDWKPHEKSTQLGYLAGLVATMPSWLVSMVAEGQLDLAFDAGTAEARAALAATTGERLLGTTWRLLMNGQVLSEETRYEAVRALRLNQKPVPSLYGPSADEAYPGA